MLERYKTILLYISALLSAGLASFVYTPGASMLVFVSLAPLLFALSSHHRRRHVFGAGFLFGIVYAGVLLRWALAIFPTDWFGLTPFGGLVSLTFSWLLSISSTGILSGVFTLAAYRLIARDAKPWRLLLVLPSCWVLTEAVAPVIFSIIWLGDSSTVNGHWLFLSFGYGLASNAQLLAITRLGGVFLGSFLVVFVNVLLYILKNHAAEAKKMAQPFWQPASLRPVFGGLGIVFAAIFYGYISFARDFDVKKEITVAAITTNVPPMAFNESLPEETWLQEYKAAEEAAKQKPDVFIFPENSWFISQKPLFIQLIASSLTHDQKPALLVDMIHGSGQSNEKLQIAYVDSQKGILTTDDKILLVPNGEYLPHLTSFLVNLLGSEATAQKLKNQRYFMGAVSDPRPVIWQGSRFGALSCSGIFSPFLYRNLVRDGAEMLINTASYTSFSKSPVFMDQMRVRARLQAASLARPLAQATNGNASYVINAKGQVIAENMFEQKEDAIVSSIHISAETTPFARFGNWPVLLALFVIVGESVLKRLQIRADVFVNRQIGI